MVFFIILSKIKFIKNAFNSLIFKIGHKLSKAKTKNFLKVVDAYDANSIVEITLVDIPNNFKNKTLEEIKIRQNYNLTVLAITRENKIINNIKKEDFFKEKDIVTVYGNFDDIKKVFIEDVEKEIKEFEKAEKVEK
jgi:trk system potassium uptake protein TrkA